MTTAPTKTRKPSSPPTPSRPLDEAMADAKKLYIEYSHGKFARSEIASKLGVSASSGPFAARLFTLKAYGLIDESGADYAVSDRSKVLNSTSQTDAEFKQTALDAIRGSDIFRELLDEFRNKLPSNEAVAGRLKTQKKFNPESAKKVANGWRSRSAMPAFSTMPTIFCRFVERQMDGEEASLRNRADKNVGTNRLRKIASLYRPQRGP